MAIWKHEIELAHVAKIGAHKTLAELRRQPFRQQVYQTIAILRSTRTALLFNDVQIRSMMDDAMHSPLVILANVAAETPDMLCKSERVMSRSISNFQSFL